MMHTYFIASSLADFANATTFSRLHGDAGALRKMLDLRAN
jgi:hypothetical protein